MVDTKIADASEGVKKSFDGLSDHRLAESYRHYCSFLNAIRGELRKRGFKIEHSVVPGDRTIFVPVTDPTHVRLTKTETVVTEI